MPELPSTPDGPDRGPRAPAEDGPDPDPLAALRLDPPGPAERLEEWWLLARRRPLLAVGVAGVLALVVALAVVLLRPGAPPVEDTLPVVSEPSTPPPSSTPSTGTELVVVHAAGAVLDPGVYELPAGSRVGDLVAAAGGLAPDADADRINLAEGLVDGARLWIPRLGEVSPPEVAGGVEPGRGPSDAGPAAGSGRADGTVDVNTADPAELEELPGVGPVIAEAIVTHREQHGPFRSVEDLLDVRGIGEAKLSELRDHVVL